MWVEGTIFLASILEEGFFFLGLLTLAKIISAYKMCTLNSGNCDPFNCCCFSPQAESSEELARYSQMKSVHELWPRCWKAAVKLSLYGTGAHEICAGPGLTSRLEQMEGNGGPGAHRELGEGRTVAAGREVTQDNSLHKILGAEVTCCCWIVCCAACCFWIFLLWE